MGIRQKSIFEKLFQKFGGRESLITPFDFGFRLTVTFQFDSKREKVLVEVLNEFNKYSS